MQIPRSPTENAGWVGQLISGRYQIECLIGQGGMGSVFLANDTRLNTRVVLKVPRLELFQEEGLRSRFSLEAQTLCRLSHAHIVRVIDVGEHNQIPYLVLPFMEGGNLSQRRQQIVVTQGARSYPSLLVDLGRWILPVAQALDALHREGVIHRDIKPANILFDRHGQVYLSDFGIAKFLYAQRPASEMTHAGAVPGTPEYMAPELLLGQSYDGRVDQYALAIVVYETLSGICPFRGGTAANVMLRQMTFMPDDLHLVAPWIGAGFSAVVRQGMSKHPQLRLGSSEEFARSLLRQLEINSFSIPTTPTPLPITPHHAFSNLNVVNDQNDASAVDSLLPPSIPSRESTKLDAADQGAPWYVWLAAMSLPFPAVIGGLVLFDIVFKMRLSDVINPLFIFALAAFVAGWFTRHRPLMCDLAILAVAVWFALCAALPFFLGR